jgi:carotenoid 1,2-hydratase
MLDERLRFDRRVSPGGYAWWYLDAESPDGAAALTIIAFIGSVFSPYYAWSGRRSPENHCALNVALYGRRRRWAMTERSRAKVDLAPDRFTIGPSALEWRNDELTINIDEHGAPVPAPMRGTVTVRPAALGDRSFQIDAQGRHRWRPLAPRSHVTVAFDEPAVSWAGEGYLDSNDGEEPLEDAFQSWNWARLSAPGARPLILYDTAPRRSDPRRLALEVSADGGLIARDSPALVHAAPTPVFRMERLLGGDGAGVSATLEDAPFYSRSLMETTLDGRRYRGFHESLSGDRLRSPVVKAMLPFRMPRHDF